MVLGRGAKRVFSWATRPRGVSNPAAECAASMLGNSRGCSRHMTAASQVAHARCRHSAHSHVAAVGLSPPQSPPAPPRRGLSVDKTLTPPPLEEKPATKTDPAHFPIKMPEVGSADKYGDLAKWLKQEGDEIKNGDVLCEVELEEFSFNVKVEDGGFLAKILVPEGSKDVSVGTNLALLVRNREDLAAYTEPINATPGISSAPRKAEKGHS